MDNNYCLELTLLKEEQVFGNKRLKMFEKYGAKCAITDMAILLGGMVSVEEKKLKNRTGYWWTRTCKLGKAITVDTMGAKNWCTVYRRTGGVRPVVSYSKIKSLSMNKVCNKDGLLEVEYGEYPQMIVEKGLWNVLEKKYNKGILKKTGKQYCMDSVLLDEYEKKFIPRFFDEYEYKGKKYIRFVGDGNSDYEKLSDGSEIVIEEVYWIEVLPIKWLVDKKNDVALSKEIIVSGIQFAITEYNGNFFETEMYKFMNKYLVKDIIPSGVEFKANKEGNNENIALEEQLIGEIKEQLQLIKDHKDKVMDLSLRVNMLLDNYNQDISKISDKSLLVVGDQTIAYLQKNLILELEEVLDELKKLNISIKIYYEIRDYLEEMLEILNNEEVEIDTELKKDFRVISNVIIPFLNSDEQVKMRKVFGNILEEELQRVNDTIVQIVMCEKVDYQEYQTINEFELLVRKKIHSSLEMLNERVIKCDVSRRILDGTRQIIENCYKNDRYNLISFYVNVMNEIYCEIKEKYKLSDKESELLLEVIQTKVDTEQELHKVIKQLMTIINRLYNIMFDLEEREAREQVIKKSYIRVRI